MRVARMLLACFLGIAVVAYSQGNTFDKIRYNGGTLRTNVDPKDWGNRLTVASDEVRLNLKDGQSLRIIPRNVSGLSYGQEAHRRVGTMIALGLLVAPLALFGLFHKARVHFIGIEYTTEEGKKGGVLIQAHKDNYRAVLMALRGVTGAPIAVAEDDRKYVPSGIETAAAVSPEKVAQGPEPVKATPQPAAPETVQAPPRPEAAQSAGDDFFVASAPAPVVNPKALSKSDILELLTNSVPSPRVTTLVKERGIKFAPTTDDLKAIVEAGGDEELVEALKQAAATLTR
jgi:hypothetical protein